MKIKIGTVDGRRSLIDFQSSRFSLLNDDESFTITDAILADRTKKELAALAWVYLLPRSAVTVNNPMGPYFPIIKEDEFRDYGSEDLFSGKRAKRNDVIDHNK